MLKVLQLKTSILDAQNSQGVSSQLSDELVERLRQQHAGLEVTLRDFSKTPVPYFDNAWLQALMTPVEQRSAEQVKQARYSDDLITEVKEADVLVIGVPMYNFMIPAMLKSWTDHIARAGVTFKYTASGSEGLLENKKVYLVMSTGGMHEEAVTDFIRPFMRVFLGFLGISNVEFIVADGLNMGEEPRNAGFAQARKAIEQLNSQGELA